MRQGVRHLAHPLAHRKSLLLLTFLALRQRANQTKCAWKWASLRANEGIAPHYFVGLLLGDRLYRFRGLLQSVPFNANSKRISPSPPRQTLAILREPSRRARSLPMHPLKTYLTELLIIRSPGANTPETSFYGPFADLLNAAGQALKPRVRCVMGLKNQGAGMPDGGLYTPDQFQRGDDEPLAGQAPARGVIECKKVKDDAGVTADSAQVAGYLSKYAKCLSPTTAISCSLSRT